MQTDAELDNVVQFLGRRTGLTFPAYRRDIVHRTIRQAMSRARTDNFEHYQSVLQADRGVFDTLVDQLTIGETYFFREPQQFEFVRQEIIPDIRRRRQVGEAARVWSAACSSGEEAYSLAMLFSQEGLGESVFILATDICRDALERCRRADYRSWSFRGPGAALTEPYLRRRGEICSVEERIRRMVSVEYLNLAGDGYPSFGAGAWGMDLIFCRNVLIYFDPATVAAVARRLYECLTPGGWLFTASCDPPLVGFAAFQQIMTPAGIVYRRPVEIAIAPAPLPSFSLPPIELPPIAPSARLVYRDPESEPVRFDPPIVVAPIAQAHPPLDQHAGESETLKRIRSLANVDPAAAERACAVATEEFSLSAQVHLLHGVLFLGLGHVSEAVRSVRRTLFLDPTLAIAHLTLGSILLGRGDRSGARRAYARARDLCAARPADELVPLGDGECAGQIVEAAVAQLAHLDVAKEMQP